MNPIYTAIALLGVTSTIGEITPISEVPSSLYSQPSQTILAATKLTSCGTDWDCFINLAKTCTPAQVRGDTFINVFGMMDYTITGLYEIWGQNENKCVWFSRSESIQIQLSAQFRSLARSQGMTPQQIAEYEQELTAEVSQYLGDSICRFNQANDLATYLEIITRRRSDQDLGLGLGGYIYFDDQEVALCESKLLNSVQ